MGLIGEVIDPASVWPFHREGGIPDVAGAEDRVFLPDMLQGKGKISFKVQAAMERGLSSNR